MWTKLANLSLSEALLPKVINGKWRGAEISSRYRNELRKEFLKAGVPWEWDKKHTIEKHPFDRPPKHTKRLRNKADRIARINKALEKQEDLKLKYRQELAKKKPLVGFDFFIRSSIGNYVKSGK